MISYTAWFRPTASDLRFEWETEWDKMRYFLNTDYFDQEENLVSLFSNYGRPIRLTKAMDQQVRRRTHCATIKELDACIASYRSAARRKGVPDKLAAAFRADQPLAMPIVVRSRGTLWVAGGNTRLDVAEILKVSPDPTVLFVDLDAPEVKALVYGDDDEEITYDD